MKTTGILRIITLRKRFPIKVLEYTMHMLVCYYYLLDYKTPISLKVQWLSVLNPNNVRTILHSNNHHRIRFQINSE